MLAYSKLHKKFREDISIAKCLSTDDMFRFSKIVEIQGEHESVIERISLYRQEMSEKNTICFSRGFSKHVQICIK